MVAAEGRKLLRRLGRQRVSPALVMDRAYEGDATRQLALDLGFTPVVPQSCLACSYSPPALPSAASTVRRKLPAPLSCADMPG